MSWRPTFLLVPDARLDPYRDRCAALYRAGDLIGHVLVLSEYFADQSGGHLWWRRWEPDRELAKPLIRLCKGTDFDQPVPSDELDAELEYWSRGKFPLLGELLDLVWLTPEEAIQLAPDVFGVTCCFDDDDRVVWSYPIGPEASR